MTADKQEALENAGFRIGSVQDFLGLDDQEHDIVELKYQQNTQAKSLLGNPLPDQEQNPSEEDASQ